jgi:hypothetical protein
MTCFSQVSEHFTGRQSMLSILEDGMDTLEKGTENATSSMSMQYMAAGNAAEHLEKVATASPAAKLATQITKAKGVTKGDQLERMFAGAVAQHLCAGRDSVSRERLITLVDGFVEKDLVSLFMHIAAKPTAASNERVTTPRGGAGDLRSDVLESCIATANLPMLNVAGILLLLESVLSDHEDGFPAWATQGADIVRTMLEPLIERVTIREKEIGGSGGSLEPPGPLLEPPGPLLTHLHAGYMAYSERLPTR